MGKKGSKILRTVWGHQPVTDTRERERGKEKEKETEIEMKVKNAQYWAEKEAPRPCPF